MKTHRHDGRCFGRALWFLLILLLPVVALLIWHLSARVANNRTINKLEAKARQKGDPLTLMKPLRLPPPDPKP